MIQLKRVSLWAALVAVVAETGLKNVLVSALVTVGTPATATGFVYEVMRMRYARLEHEARDRAAVVAKATATDDPDDSAVPRPAPPPPPKLPAAKEEEAAEDDKDLPRRLDAMLSAREHFVDIYGGNPEAVTPAYQKLAADMLAGDERVFPRIEAAKVKDPIFYDRDLVVAATRLRALHAQIAALLPARIVTIETPGAGASTP
jgi:hypothetical protein